MPFEYFNPCTGLSRYIHSYWTLKGDDELFDTLYPDACVDIVVNMGETFDTNVNNVTLQAQGVYLGGALTEAMSAKIPVGVHLLGIRFLPGCFAHFYPTCPLGELTNECIELSYTLIC
jgi:hypothetical protein